VLDPAQYLAALADPDDGLRRIVTARVFKCVRCLDPDGAVGVHAGQGSVIGRGGMFFILRPGIDLQSPALEQAARACGLRGP
jgi:hypothetical protein